MSDSEFPDPVSDELLSSTLSAMEIELQNMSPPDSSPLSDLAPLGPAALTRELVSLSQEIVTAASEADPLLLHTTIERVWAEVLSLASREERATGEVVAAFLGWMSRLPQLHAAAAISLTHRGLGTSALEVNTEAASRIRAALSSIEAEDDAALDAPDSPEA